MADKNTNFSGVDLTQDPEDFKNLAFGKTPEAPPAEAEAKPEESAAGTPPLPKEAAPQDNADKPADETKPVEEQKPEPKTPDVTPPAKEMNAEEYRQKEAARMIQRQGEERKRAMLAHIEAAKSNPDHIHTVAKFDKKLANEVIKEVWGYQDYDELLAQSKIAELKESNPDQAAVEERLMRLELEAKRATTTAKEQLEKSFFVSKGFAPTEFDPRYVKTLEKLALLNPTYVASDYTGALAEAYRMATGEEVVDVQKDKMQEAMNRAAPSSTPSSIKQPHTTSVSHGDKADEFAGLLGVKLN
jgi:hypothetical protein